MTLRQRHARIVFINRLRNYWYTFLLVLFVLLLFAALAFFFFCAVGVIVFPDSLKSFLHA
jgi:hypothetical protein